jgi:hypothetical protein
VVPDPRRFPAGIKALADYAHQNGMLFGFCESQLRVCSQSARHVSSGFWFFGTSGRYGDGLWYLCGVPCPQLHRPAWR